MVQWKREEGVLLPAGQMIRFRLAAFFLQLCAETLKIVRSCDRQPSLRLLVPKSA